MEIRNIPFGVFDVMNAVPERHKGTTGEAIWRTIRSGDIRVRVVEYTKGYLADHWCNKGHVVFVLEGAFRSELKDGRTYTLTKGMCFLVADDAAEHRSYTEDGVALLIVD